MRYKKGIERDKLNLGLVENLICTDHYIRILDLFVDRSVSSDEESYSQKGKSKTGQRPYGSRTFLKLYIYGYFNRISSSRKLEQETQRNIELIWLLKGLQPDFKTIADYRKDNGEAIRQVLKDFKRFLQENGYIKGEKVSIDGTRVKANTNRSALSVKKIENRLTKLNKELDKYTMSLNLNDALEKETLLAMQKIAELHEEIEDLLKKKETIEGSDKNRISFTDPDASLSHSRDGCMPIYNAQSVVCDEHKMIMSLETTTTSNDRNNLKLMVDQVEQEYGELPKIARADSDYFNIVDIQQLEEQGVDCYVNVPKNAEQKQGKDEHGNPITFTYDDEHDQYNCSLGRPLSRRGYEKNKGDRGATRYQGTQCQGCPAMASCTKSKKGRTIYKYDDEEWKDNFIKKIKSPTGQRELAKRRAYVEHPFGTIKVTMMDRLQLKLRGKYKVQTELCLYHFAYNFKRLLNSSCFDEIVNKIENFDFTKCHFLAKKYISIMRTVMTTNTILKTN